MYGNDFYSNDDDLSNEEEKSEASIREPRWNYAKNHTPGEDEEGLTYGENEPAEAWIHEETIDDIKVYIRNRQYDVKYNYEKYFFCGKRRKQHFHGRHRHYYDNDMGDYYED